MVDLFIVDFGLKRSVHLSPLLGSYGQTDFEATITTPLSREDVIRKLNEAREVQRPPDFTGNHLQGTDLRELDLKQAIMVEADLSGANLEGANLSEVDLRRAKLQGANLKNTHLSHATLYKATYDDFTVWPSDFNPSTNDMVAIHRKKP